MTHETTNKTARALIGYTGFVGSTLLKQASFEDLYRSTNIQDIDNKTFDTVVCAGAPAQKWLANKDPEDDLQKIERLISHLKTIQCKTFVLISTVDVFKSPLNIDEETPAQEDGLHPYGLHRHLLEKFVASHFENALIVRLPGLVGPGLRKNVIFDLLNNNNLDVVDSRGVFQFYPMVNLWADIQVALQKNLKLVHLTAEPIAVHDIASKGFGINFNNEKATPPAQYNMKTRHADLYGKSGGYQYSKTETCLAIRAYAQSEPKTKKESAA